MMCFKIIGGEIVPEIDMEFSKTIYDLKQEIEKVLGVGVERQRLRHNNRELEDDDAVEACGFMSPQETLNLTVTPLPPGTEVQLLVKHDSGSRYLRVRETDTVSDLRNQIQRKMGVFESQFTLRRSNKEMVDQFPLSAYYVNENTEIEISVVDIGPR